MIYGIKKNPFFSKGFGNSTIFTPEVDDGFFDNFFNMRGVTLIKCKNAELRMGHELNTQKTLKKNVEVFN